jgi:hypothetical protein
LTPDMEMLRPARGPTGACSWPALGRLSQRTTAGSAARAGRRRRPELSLEAKGDYRCARASACLARNDHR